MTIKMSDRIDDLPIKFYTGFDDYAAAIAINAYDDNQELIAQLEQALKLNDDEIANSEAIKASIAALTDAKIKEQQQEINKFLELNASLNGQAVRQVAMYNERVVENNELKAHTKLVYEAACRVLMNNDTTKIKGAGQLDEAIDRTLVQSLQSVQADAVKAFGHEIGLYNSEYDDQEYIEVSRYSLREHIEQLREGKS